MINDYTIRRLGVQGSIVCPASTDVDYIQTGYDRLVAI